MSTQKLHTFLQIVSIRFTPTDYLQIFLYVEPAIHTVHLEHRRYFFLAKIRNSTNNQKPWTWFFYIQCKTALVLQILSEFWGEADNKFKMHPCCPLRLFLHRQWLIFDLFTQLLLRIKYIFLKWNEIYLFFKPMMVIFEKIL